MKVTVNDLKTIWFFNEYNHKQLADIAAMCTFKEFSVKEVLFEQYDELSEVFILAEGSISMGISIGGNKRIHLGTIEVGELFSWSAVFKPYISTAWVMAITPAKVIAIDSKRLTGKIANDCEFGLITMTKIAITISHRLSDTRFQLMNQLVL
jgi:CRP-like cAMP-binding protein